MRTSFKLLFAFIAPALLFIGCATLRVADAPADLAQCGGALESGIVDETGVLTFVGSISPAMVNRLEAFETSAEVVLRDSPGGYVQPARQLAQSGRPIRITGEYCSSACAIILIESPNACVESSVREIVFHSIIANRCEGSTLVRQVDQGDTRTFLSGVRQPLRDRLAPMANREELISIPIQEFLRTYPEKQCR